MEERNHNKCLLQVEEVLVSSSKVHSLLQSIEELGCKVPNAWIKCAPCNLQPSKGVKMSGGFTFGQQEEEGIEASPKIVICENEKLNKVTLEDTLLHELIHAYDFCRAKIDVSNCAQHACAEIRASALSGECSSLKKEILRGEASLSLAKGFQKCIQRRAIKSVRSNPHCSEKYMAENAVKAVFEKCFWDTAPFENHSCSSLLPRTPNQSLPSEES